MAEDYVKHISNASTETPGSVSCGNGDISSSYSSTLKFKELNCENDVKINVDHSSTIIIDQLKCTGGTITVAYSSTLHINNIDCDGSININIANASTMVIDRGKIQKISGNVTNVSTGICRTSIEIDTVSTSGGSTWKPS